MQPGPNLWLWCLRGTLASMTFDLCFRINTQGNLISVAEFNIAWALYGGTPDDPVYNSYIWTFQATEIEVENPPDPPVKYYRMEDAWWDDVLTVFFTTPLPERVCKLPEYQ